MSERLQQYLEQAVIKEEEGHQIIELPATGSVESTVIELTDGGELDEIGKSIAWVHVQRILREAKIYDEIDEVGLADRLKTVIGRQLIGN
jgi:hypothetical protein